MPGICILTETFYPVTGGGESQALALASGLVDKGWRVFVITRRSDACLAKMETIQGIGIYRVTPTGPGHLKKWGLLVTTLGILIRQRKQYNFILVSGFRILGVPAVLVGALFKKKTILKADSLGEMSGSFFRDGLRNLKMTTKSPVFRCFLKLRNAVLKRCSAFIAISSPVETELIAQGIDKHHIARIPNSVDLDQFYPVNTAMKRRLRQELGIDSDIFIVTYAGRLVSYKGLPLLLRVWRDVHERYGASCLMLVGAGSLDMHNCERELKTFVHENGLDDGVRFAGSVHNVHEYLQISDVFVLPSEREAFGIVLIEAMACGLPIIATNVGGIADIITNDSSGLLIEANNFRQLQSSLDRLFNDADMRTALGAAARQAATRYFSQDEILDQYLKLFQKLYRPMTEC
jgi:glycosyltransferase involved in cell wall biosynthesis